MGYLPPGWAFSESEFGKWTLVGIRFSPEQFVKRAVLAANGGSNFSFVRQTTSDQSGESERERERDRGQAGRQSGKRWTSEQEEEERISSAGFFISFASRAI